MHVCLFDIDGTLLATGGAGQKAMEAALRAEFGELRPVVGISTAGRTDRAITSDLFAFFGIEGHPEVVDRFLAAYLQHLPHQLAECTGLILPGVAELLKLLAARDDVLLGLLTGNYREGARMKLEHYGLFDYFQFGGFGDVHPHRDDVARSAVDEVCRRLGRAPEPGQLWVIGDTPADVQCGRAVGASVIAVATGMYSADQLRATNPDYLFDDFSNPQAVVDLLK
jgi:phosphoglycolate phosphatase-like HAD superfamily hydrolase